MIVKNIFIDSCLGGGLETPAVISKFQFKFLGGGGSLTKEVEVAYPLFHEL
jgi:hypothetical protein